MRARLRTAARLLASLAVVSGGARAGVTGNVEVQGQSTGTQAAGGASTQAAILMETLSLHYAGMPFGAAVAVATAGGGVSNVRGWSDRAHRFDARLYSFDGSLGLLPRRGVPLRLYASGAVPDGSTGLLASAGAGPSLTYGGTLQAAPGRLTPGLRLDASEARSSRPGHAAMTDLQRRLVASSFGAVAGQRVDLAVRLEEEQRDGAGSLETRAAALSVTSPAQQTQLAAADVRRSFAALSGITSDRTASATTSRRWSSRLSTQLGARYAEARAAAATGTLGDVRAGATWVALQDVAQVTLSASGDAGFTRTSAPLQRSSGSTSGGAARASWSRPLGPLSATVGAGGATTRCDCAAGAAGTTDQAEASASLALLPVGGISAQADYGVARAFAPIARGGDRLEQHARLFGRVPAGAAAHLTASVSLDDGVRELVDVTTGGAVTLREQAASAALGAAARLGATTLSAEVRHARGRVVTEAGAPFVVGSTLAIPAVTSAQATAAWSPRYDLSLQGQLVGSWVTFRDRPGTTSLGANAALAWRLGRISISAHYQTFRVDPGTTRASLQQTVRGVLSRPFEL